MFDPSGPARYERAGSCDALEAAMTPRSKPRLCIGLPVYNGENYLAQAIESLLGQTFSDFRLVISDNASTDRTEAICRTYARSDGRIEYHRSAENRGAAWNFNRVVDLADAEYFKWSAHDDCCAPTFVERCVEALDADSRAILCYPTSYIIDERGEILATYRDPEKASAAIPYQRFKAVVRSSGLSHMLFGVIRLDVLRETRLHGAYPASDVILLAELALRGTLIEVDEPLLLWREHGQRATRANRSDTELAIWYAPENAGRVPLRHWTLFAHYLGVIARVPLPPGQRLRCSCLMAYWFLVRFRALRDEAARGAADIAQRALRRAAAPPRPPSTRVA